MEPYSPTCSRPPSLYSYTVVSENDSQNKLVNPLSRVAGNAMADPFGTGAGILGVVSLAIQITQLIVQFGIDWKDAPTNVKTFMAELGTLKAVLSETNTNILLNPDFGDAFENRPSLLLSQLGPNAPATTDTKVMLEICQKNLESLLRELEKRCQGRRVGWERLKAAFLAKDTRESVENLCRQCQTLNNMLSIDATVLGATIHKEVREVRKEQQEWRQNEAEISLAIRGSMEKSNQRQENQERQVILDWLTPFDYAAQQSDFIGRQQAGTGQWLLDSAEFQNWLNTDKQTLFCPGIPGAGKTILTSIVVEELTTRFNSDKTVEIAYIYCNFKRQAEQKLEDLLASLLKQLSQDRSSVPDSIKSLYAKHSNRRTRPSVDEISKALHSVTALYSKVLIIIDALDECQVFSRCRGRFLAEVFDLQAKCGANIFATSRFIPEITEKFEGSSILEIRASDQDVWKYLDGHMARLSKCVSRSLELQEKIKASIVQTVDGMFLLAQLHLDSLTDKTTPRAITRALEKLPRGSDALDRAYEEAIQRIRGQEAGFEKLAWQVLSWITCAKRPFTNVELQHALAIEDDDLELDTDNFQDIEEIVSFCAGLVTIDDESNVVRLVHYTTQEYFERTQKDWFPDAETEITKTCIVYLSLNTFGTGFCASDEEFESRLQENALYDYAARNWGYHARSASTQVGKLVIGFLNSVFKVSACQAMMVFRTSTDYSQCVPKMGGLHIAAYFGLTDLMTDLLQLEHIDSQDSYGRTSLSRAAEQGHETMVKLLLEKGADVDLPDEEAWTPLRCAAFRGHEAVVKLLLENGANIDLQDMEGQTLLSLAAASGQEAVAQMALEKGANAEIQDIDNWTPLWHAAVKGHAAVAKLLLENGASFNLQDESGQTPLSAAAAGGHKAVVKELLEKGASFDLLDSFGQTPLFIAAKGGHKAIVKVLLEKGASFDFQDSFDQTPLLIAAKRGHEGVVKLLIEQGANVNLQDKKVWTILLCAAVRGQEAVVKLLLEKGANFTRLNMDNWTPLLCAVEEGRTAIVKLLLENNADVDFQDVDGRTLLSFAAEEGQEAVVNLLLEKGATFNLTDKNGQTPLFCAAKDGREAVVKLLLEKGASFDLQDNFGQAPLFYAAEEGQEAVVKLLLEKGASFDVQDKTGRTSLFYAAEEGREAVVKLLLEKGASFDVQDNFGRTSLFYAAEEGQEAIVKLLLEKGASFNLQDSLGQAPLSLAARGGHKAVAKLH